MTENRINREIARIMRRKKSIANKIRSLIYMIEQKETKTAKDEEWLKRLEILSWVVE